MDRRSGSFARFPGRVLSAFQFAKKSMAREEVQIWCADTDVEVDPLPLSPEEMLRASRFVFDHDRRRWIAAHVLLRRALGEHLSVEPSSLRFNNSAYGKPVVASPSSGRNLCFNLSHAANAAVCTIARNSEIGIDIERIRPVENIESVFRSFATVREYAAFMHLSGDERQTMFFKVWTLKEACLKAEGTGLSIPPGSVEVLNGSASRTLVTIGLHHWCVIEFSIGSGWTGALALSASDGRVAAPKIVWRTASLERGDGFTLNREWTTQMIERTSIKAGTRQPTVYLHHA
jgi:4'-phosphopantetheinyl transferase